MEQKTMKACVLVGPSQLEIQDYPLPKIVDPTDAILKFRLGTICSSDVHKLPMHHGKTRVMGHEFIGEVVEVGSGVKNIKVGQRYLCEGAHYCGECDYCKNEIYSFCQNGGVMGSLYPIGTCPDGCFAEYVRVKWADRGCLVPVPDACTDEDVMMNADVLTTGYFLDDFAGLKEGDTVAINGVGPIGMGACLSAKKFFKAKTVIAIDILQSRLDLCKEHGLADYFINAATEDVAARVNEITEGKGVNVSGDTSSAPNFLDTLISITGLRGTMCSIAACMQPTTFQMGYMMMKNLTFKCGIQGFQSMNLLMDQTAKGEIDCKWMHTHVRPLNDLIEGFDIFGNNKDGVIKWIIAPYDHSRGPSVSSATITIHHG